MFRSLALFVAFLATSFSAAHASEFFDKLIDRARHSATQPYAKEAPVPDTAKLGYDAYRGIRFRPESILWRDSGSKFHVEFFPTGFLYQTPVKMYVIRRGDAVTAAAALSPSPEMFDFGAATPPASVGFAGFKVTHPLNGQKFDEIVSFLGASYFRPIGKGQAYGASARGLAIGCAAHGIGTARAFQEQALTGTFAGAAMAASALISSLWVPWMMRWL